MKATIIAAVLGAAVAPAAAGPLAEAIAHHTDGDVAALRARLPEPAARCTLGAVYARRGDLPRAALFLDGCDDASLDQEIAELVATASHELQRKLRASELSALSIVTNPPGLVAETDALPGERVATPATIWTRGGSFHVRAAVDAAALDGKAVEQTVKIAPHSRASVVLTVGGAQPGAPRDGTVNFDDNGDIGDQHAGPPPEVKHGSILPKKYIDGGTTGGPQIDDPLALESETAPRLTALRLGVRGGAGSFGAGRIGPSLAAVVRLRAPWDDADEPRPFALDARLDWSRRGLDVLGASVGLSKVLASPDAAWLSAGLAVRAEARLADTLDMMPVSRAALAGAATLDLSLRRLPVTVGTRYEQAVTEHSHAFLVELGVDWGR